MSLGSIGLEAFRRNEIGFHRIARAAADVASAATHHAHQTAGGQVYLLSPKEFVQNDPRATGPLNRTTLRHVLVLARTGVGAALRLPFALSRDSCAAIRRHGKPLLAFVFFEIIAAWWLLSDAERHLTSSMTGLLIAASPIIAAISRGHAVASNDGRVPRIRRAD